MPSKHQHVISRKNTRQKAHRSWRRQARQRLVIESSRLPSAPQKNRARHNSARLHRHQRYRYSPLKESLGSLLGTQIYQRFYEEVSDES